MEREFNRMNLNGSIWNYMEASKRRKEDFLPISYP